VVVLANFKQEEDAIEIEEIIRATRRLFTDAGIPVYDDVKRAIRSLSLVSNYYRQRKKDMDEVCRKEQ
jgi:acyl-CoA synthetase (NDP forming)